MYKIIPVRAAIILFVIVILPFKIFSQEYFQQEVNYKMDVRLNDVDHFLNANIEIVYINNSPGALNEIYMHLWPNAYKNNSTALAKQLLEQNQTNFYYADDKHRGYIDSFEFKVNGEAVSWNYDEKHIDICKIILNAPLESGKRLTITTPFRVKIPKGVFSRLGHIEQAYQITQWYPKPAVYDRNGWNQMPYLTQGEFYSEFGSYDVSITLPKNYVVGATGDLVNGESELEWLEMKARKTEKLTEFPKDNLYPSSDAELKTLRYRQSNVHDFAWFADKRYHVLKGEVELPHSKRKVTLWTMFTNAEAKLWTKSIEYMHDAVYYYSLWNGDYPYNHATAVDGALSAGGGMEYPNVTVIGASGNAFGLETVIMHEVGHNWFYGILGSDERQHPWLDEGINSFNELRYLRTKYPEAGLFGQGRTSKLFKTFDLGQYKHKKQYELAYLINARRNLDQPIELPAPEYTLLNYGGIVYSKAAIVFDYLKAYLGEETFDKAMKQYFETWKFKHPQPDDLRKIMEEVSQKDLSWFFNDIIKTTKKIDYKIVSSKKSLCVEMLSGNCYEITVKNKGKIASPYSISVIKDDNVIATDWHEGFKGRKTFMANYIDYDQLKLDAKLDIPETNRKNNTLKAKGLFKKTEPLKLQFIGSVENPDKTQLFYSPVIGWNNYNKTMLGIAFYNNVFPQKKFEYVLAPMYSFGTNREAGMVSLGYNIYPSRLFQSIRFGINASKFAYAFNVYDQHFTKLAPQVNFELKKKNARSNVTKNILLRSVNISEDILVPNENFTGYNLDKNNYYVNDLDFIINNNKVINPYNLKTNIQQGDRFLKASVELNYKFSYPGKKKGIDVRLFAGKFLYNEYSDVRFNFFMSGNRDYTYDHIFLGRTENEGVFSQQFAMNDGGFKNRAFISSSNWLTSINVKVPFPGRIPLSLYGDAGLSPYISTNINFAWDAGIALNLIPNIFEIYFPVAMSGYSGLTYSENIRFVLNIHKLNPFNLIRNFEL